MLSHDLRDQSRADLSRVDIGASRLGPAVKLQSQMMRARKFQNCAADALPRLVFESEYKIARRNLIRQTYHVGVHPPAAAVVQHPKPEQVGEGGNAARIETPAIKKHPVPRKEFRGVAQFNSAGNVEMVIGIENEFVAMVHE